MVLTKIWLLPIAYGICAITATATKYLFVSLLKKYPHILPFFSHRDASLFGECIFAHLVTYSSFLLILITYLRHRQTVEYYAHRLEWENSTWRYMSTFIAFFGFFAALCITIVAHCEDERLALVHNLADTLAFSSGLIYSWGQALLTWILIPRMCTLRICALRFFLLILETIVFGFYCFSKDDPAFSSTWMIEASLWTISVCFHLFITTFFVELRFSYLHSPKVVFVRSNESDQQNLVNNMEQDDEQNSNDDNNNS